MALLGVGIEAGVRPYPEQHMDYPSNFAIRPLRPTDQPAWAALWTGYLEYYESTLPEAVYASTFERLLSGRSNEYRCLIATLDEKPVGLAHYLFHRSCWSIEDKCYLQDLFVQPDQRGRHFGRALIEAVYDAADEADAPGVYWLTQHFNSTGRRLYDRVGELSDFIVYQRPGHEA